MEVTGILKIEKRTDTSTSGNKKLRKAGYLPGNIYGKGVESIAVAVKKDELRKSLIRYGRTAVLKLEMEGEKPYTVVLKEIQNAPVSGEYVHVDFQQISLLEEMKSEVLIKFIGRELLEAKGLLLMRQMDTILVRGLPHEVPSAIEIDVTDMQAGDSMLIQDIKLPKGIVAEVDAEQLVISVREPRVRDQDTADEEKTESNEEES
jgi:large subunit ribosomal protein L25